MVWAAADWKGTRFSRALKGVLSKYKANANKMGLKRGYGQSVGLVIGDTSPTGQVTAKEGTIAVRYSVSASMPGVPAAVYMNTDGSTTWVDISA